MAVEYRVVEPTTKAKIRTENSKTYRVGNDGSFWSKSIKGDWVRLNPIAQKSGHLRVYLGRDNENMRFLHRLVLEAFVGPCPDGLECCHENDDPADNRLSNLCWGTPKRNGQDRVRNGRTNPGERAATAKLHAWQVRDILRRCQAGENQGVIADEYGVGVPNIQAILTGRSWNTVTGLPKRDRQSEGADRAKLTPAEVLSVVERCRAGEQQKDVARSLGVKATTVWAIMNGFSWNAVTGFERIRNTGGTASTLRDRAATKGRAAG